MRGPKQVTMMRTFGYLAASAAVFVSGVGAAAQTASSASEYASCPRGRLSIYFASGETKTSPEAIILIDRISETAASCQPDGIDLVARVDKRVDGDQAMSLALARLAAVSDDLVAKGFSVDRIRVAAQAVGMTPETQLNQIDVIFRKTGNGADDVASPSIKPYTAPNSTI